MPCFNPDQGFDSVLCFPSGKPRFTYNEKLARRVGGVLQRRSVRCRKCEGCRYDDSREWAVKIAHEAQMTDEQSFSGNSSFITLTYSDDKIPQNGSLDYFGDWTLFLNRLRMNIFRKYGQKIRYYMVGEYGSKNLRPHYHAIIFGFSFPDKYDYLERFGNVISRSPFLEENWRDPADGVSFGYSSIGSVSYASIAYVARYNQKKLIGKEFDGFEYYVNEEGEELTRPRLHRRYVRNHPELGEIFVAPERALMSKRGGGIGKAWFDKYGLSDMYSSFDYSTGTVYKDHTHLSNGMIVRPPKYYDKLLERVDPSLLEGIKQARQDHQSKHVDELDPDRLRQKREVLLQKLNRSKRTISEIY